MILDWHNCSWLLRYPRERLAGGSMYAFQLPDPLPAAGEPGGPPRPEDLRPWGGITMSMDLRAVMYRCIRDPQEMKPTIERMMREFREEQERRQRKGQP
jgi:hypothetical protein